MGLAEDLAGKVGTEVGVGDWHTITQEQIDGFADATLDHQWIHVDLEKEYLKSSRRAPATRQR